MPINELPREFRPAGDDKSRELSRRSMLRMVAAVGGVIAASASLHALGGQSAAAATSQSATSDASSSEMNQFVDATRADSFTNLAGVRSEYAEVTTDFPLALPEETTFPSEPTLQDTAPHTLWERGSGVADAFMIWLGLTIAAASQAHSNGQAQQSLQLLDELDEGYASPAREAVLEDAGRYFPAAISQARQGDFAGLLALAA
ncbi:hypothetical protein ACTJKH_07305 [Microbacterium sp. 22215]|uniref:hypothetical protein n=1 Tax=Microbacterium sp. 22215 TaxID=3453893 RepID=UPI003F839BD0